MSFRPKSLDGKNGKVRKERKKCEINEGYNFSKESYFKI